MLFSSLYGVDLGTDTIKLRDRTGQAFLESKNMIALRGGKVLAIGNEAWEMYEKILLMWRYPAPCREE